MYPLLLFCVVQLLHNVWSHLLPVMMVLFLVATHLISNSSSHANWTAGRFSSRSSFNFAEGLLVFNMLYSRIYLLSLRASWSSGSPHPPRCPRHLPSPYHLHPPYSLPAQVRHMHTFVVRYAACFVIDDVKMGTCRLKTRTHQYDMTQECVLRAQHKWDILLKVRCMFIKSR